MIDGYLLNMRVPGEAGDGERLALRPLEEAAGVFAAWRARHGMRPAPRDAQGASRRDLIDGCVGTVQAVADLLAAAGATQGEVDAAIGRMDGRWDVHRDDWEGYPTMSERTCAACAGCRHAERAGGEKADTGIECPNCGGPIDPRAGHIDNGRVLVCEKGRPPMREVEYHCRHCGSTVIFLKKHEPEGVDHD